MELLLCGFSPVLARLRDSVSPQGCVRVCVYERSKRLCLRKGICFCLSLAMAPVSRCVWVCLSSHLCAFVLGHISEGGPPSYPPRPLFPVVCVCVCTGVLQGWWLWAGVSKNFFFFSATRDILGDSGRVSPGFVQCMCPCSLGGACFGDSGSECAGCFG